MAAPPALKAQFARLSALLRCPICGDWFNTATFFSRCSHNYCSLCIRRALTYKLECPTCREDNTAVDLKTNRLLDEVVRCFSGIFDALNTMVQNSPTQPGAETAIQRSQSAPSSMFKKASPGGSQDRVIKSDAASQIFELSPILVSSESQPPPAPGKGVHSSAEEKVVCPVCQLQIAASFVNTHLDSCIGDDKSRVNLQKQHAELLPKPTGKSLPPLQGAKLAYRLLSDAKLKQILKEIGLSTKGKRDDLIKRHKEFVLQYTAQQDAARPKAVEEIIRDVEAIDKKMNEVAPLKRDISEADPQFEKLIDEIRTRKRTKKTQSSESQTPPSVSPSRGPPPPVPAPTPAPALPPQPVVHPPPVRHAPLAAVAPPHAPVPKPPTPTPKLGLAGVLHPRASPTAKTPLPLVPVAPSIVRPPAAPHPAPRPPSSRTFLPSDSSDVEADQNSQPGPDEDAGPVEDSENSSPKIWSRTQSRFLQPTPAPPDPPSSPRLLPSIALERSSSPPRRDSAPHSDSPNDLLLSSPLVLPTRNSQEKEGRKTPPLSPRSRSRRR